MTISAIFSLSIEPTEGEAFLYSYHLGTDERISRDCAEEIFRNRKWFAGHGRVTIRTVALMRAGRMVDCFDGDWASDVWERDMEEAEALDRAADEAAYYDQFDGGMAYERERHP